MNKDKYYKYQMTFPFEGNKIYKSKSLSKVVKKCYKDYKKFSNINEGLFCVNNNNKKKKYKLKIKKNKIKKIKKKKKKKNNKKKKKIKKNIIPLKIKIEEKKIEKPSIPKQEVPKKEEVSKQSSEELLSNIDVYKFNIERLSNFENLKRLEEKNENYCLII